MVTAAAPLAGGGGLAATTRGEVARYSGTGLRRLREQASRRVTGMAATPRGRGYRLVQANGSVSRLSNARNYWSVNEHSATVAAIVRTFGGYYLVSRADEWTSLPRRDPAKSASVSTAGTKADAGTSTGTSTSALSTGPEYVAGTASRGPSPAQAVPSTAMTSVATSATTQPADISAVQLALDNIKLINYYPANAAWNYMWTDWQPSVMAKDFATMRTLGANAVRIIVQPDAIGYPVPTAQGLARLDQVLSLAAANGLRVQLTLFDLWNDYSDVSGSTTWLTDVVGPLRSNSEIVFFELKNEVSPSTPGQAQWISAEFPVLQRLAGDVPVTMSVSLDGSITKLLWLHALLSSDPPSFYDVHDYAEPGQFAADIVLAKTAVTPSYLYVGETGDCATSGTNQTLAAADEAYYFAAVEQATLSAGLPPAAPWAFTDFSVDALPPTVRQQPLNCGLYTAAGVAKPAAAVIQRVFATDTRAIGDDLSDVSNYDLSVGSGNVPAVWTAQLPDFGQLAWEPNLSYQAGGALKMSATMSSGQADPAYVMTPIDNLTTSDRVFNASAYVMGADSSGYNVVSISWFASDGRYLGQSVSPLAPRGSFAWTRLSVTSGAPSGAAYATLSVKSADNPGSVWFSDISWTPVG